MNIAFFGQLALIFKTSYADVFTLGTEILRYVLSRKDDQ
mgnify:CR=1 FL=1